MAAVVGLVGLLTACAATIDQTGLEQRTSQAIGESVGKFAISDRTEETGGRINYTATTRSGAIYRCYLYGATAFQNAMSFGQIPHSDAICAAMLNGQDKYGNRYPAGAQTPQSAAKDTCNALLRAAKRC